QSGYGVQGRTAAEAERIVEDAERLVDAGVFAFILELVPTELAGYLRAKLPVPVLSLGSGPDADGIYQGSADVVGYSVFQRPRSASRFVTARALAEEGICAYVEGVRARTYPP